VGRIKSNQQETILEDDMSAETVDYLNQNMLVGNTAQRGNAWWYRKGEDNHFDGPVPRERAVALLDYPLAKSEPPQLQVVTEDGVMNFTDHNRRGIVRLDTGEVFEYFKDGYQIHQPVEWVLDAMDKLLADEAQIGTVAVLRGGAVAAVQVENPETREAAEGVKHRPHLTAVTSHDGSRSSTYVAGTQAWWCDNTLSAALGEKGRLQVKVRHSRNSLGRLPELRESLGIVLEQIGDAFDAQVKALTSQLVTDEQWAAFTAAYARVDEAKTKRSESIARNKVGVLNQLWNHDERVAPWKGNAYGVLSAVNTAQHHVWGSAEDRVERNMNRLVEGKWDQIDASTLALLARV
jgi:phage/plasmid-like protein (TIGR03299 family)